MKDINLANIVSLLRTRASHGLLNKTILFLIGLFLTPISLGGALLGFARGYNRLQSQDGPPDLGNITRLMWALMATVALIVWLTLGFFTLVILKVVRNFYQELFNVRNNEAVAFLFVNLALMLVVFVAFFLWQRNATKRFTESRRYGTARLGTEADASDMHSGEGLYIGGGYAFNEMGHLMTVGATRSGKGTSLVIPALLDKTRYTGSLVIIDPKGENAAVTSRYQKEKGQDVLLLDPWRVRTHDTSTPGPDEQFILIDEQPSVATFNPMDILVNGDNLADDATMLAEMIVPENHNEREPFWNDRARSIIAGLILLLHSEGGTLIDLWRYLRLDVEEWQKLAARMQQHDNEIVAATGNEIETMMESEKMFASIMGSCLQNTDFLKSPALQRSLEVSNFELSDLTKGKMTLYIIIPADKLKSHYQWLRLVVTCAMRLVIRNYDRKVTFVLDEFPSLGPLREVSEFGLAAAAGYNMSLWMILQSLPQLQNLYRDNWENFIANTAVKHYMGVSDNFTASYISKSMGVSTFATEEMTPQNQLNIQATSRALMNPDEVRIASEKSTILQIHRRPTLLVAKQPYLNDAALMQRADPNPYHVRKAAPATA